MENTWQIVILIAIAALTVVSLFLGMIAFLNIHRKKMVVLEQAKQLEVFKAAGEAEEKEKQKIAANLHDQVLGDLVVIIRNIDLKIKSLNAEGLDGTIWEEDVIEIRRIYKDIRDISHDLVPSIVLQVGIIRALESKVANIKSSSSAIINFKNTTGYEDQMPMEIGKQLNLYRICLEILNNINKHTSYKTLFILLENNENDLLISFMHNGTGITDEEIERQTITSPGLGLKSLKSRTLLLNAKISYFVEDELANVLVQVPYK